MKKTTKKAAKTVEATQAVKPDKKVPADKEKVTKNSSKAKKTAKKMTATKADEVSKTVAKDKKLTSGEIAAYRNTLLLIQARLSGDVSMMTDAALNKNRMEASGDLSAMPIHMADIGTDNFEQEQTLAFMESESGLLDLVDDALQRIDNGNYGTCEACGNRIPRVRLNVLPFAAMCVQCAAQAQEEDMR